MNHSFVSDTVSHLCITKKAEMALAPAWHSCCTQAEQMVTKKTQMNVFVHEPSNVVAWKTNPRFPTKANTMCTLCEKDKLTKQCHMFCLDVSSRLWVNDTMGLRKEWVELVHWHTNQLCIPVSDMAGSVPLHHSGVKCLPPFVKNKIFRNEVTAPNVENGVRCKNQYR